MGLEISVSERRYFRSCRQQWVYSFREGLTSKTVSPALYVGSGIHFALEYYYKDALRRKESLFQGWKDYVKAVPCPETEYHQEAIMDVPAILTTYWYYDQEQPPWQIVATEMEIKQPIPGTDGILSGHLDLVVRDWQNALFIVDHKTSRNMMPVAGLEVDDQITSYYWLYWKLTGELPTGAIYNVISKSPRIWPVKLQNGGISKNKNQNTTYELMLAAIKSVGASTAEYQEVLAHLKQKPAVARHTTTRTLSELLTFEKNLVREYRDMLKVSADPDEVYPNPSTWNCNWCSMLTLCKAQQEGDYGTIQFIKAHGYARRDPHDTRPWRDAE